ncbi:MAG: energy-coupling factor ABC transporter ATP-binding protein, partial [Muribaculaceae bacterium]|nr:energy-coupling factor ABC transporter ATP-binding protein [Muribaculaceae bacterium]
SHHYIQFNNVHYRYPGGYEALSGVSFRVTHGEKVALLGLNGAGKSTLLLHTNGLLLPSEGEVNVGDVPVEKKTLPLVRRTVGMVFQNADDQLFMPTVYDDVAFGPRNMDLPTDEVDRRVRLALDAVGATELAGRPSFELSGGQKRAVSIATVLSMEPDILVMDEPTANLDSGARRRLLNILHGFGHTMLVATHDLDMALELCPRAILLDHGKVASDGPTASLLCDRALMAATGMDVPACLLAMISCGDGH